MHSPCIQTSNVHGILAGIIEVVFSCHFLIYMCTILSGSYFYKSGGRAHALLIHFIQYVYSQIYSTVSFNRSIISNNQMAYISLMNFMPLWYTQTDRQTHCHRQNQFPAHKLCTGLQLAHSLFKNSI